MGTGNTSLGRLHPRRSPPEPQLIPIPIGDGEDDQPPQEERDNGNGPDRVSEYISRTSATGTTESTYGFSRI